MASNTDDDDEYNDDFSDYQESFEKQQNQEEDNDDDQHKQKVNGKIEMLEQNIADLQKELQSEKLSHQETNETLQYEIKRLKSSSSKEQELYDLLNEKTEQLEKLKAKNVNLNDKLDDALSTRSDTCPPTLKEDFMKFCKKYNIFPTIKERDLSILKCSEILASDLKGSGLEKPKALKRLDSAELSAASDSKLVKRIKKLEKELGKSMDALAEVQSLRNRVSSMSERIRIEKEYKYRAEADVQASRKKVDMLSDHVEKMMICLKTESAHKLRNAEQIRNLEKDNLKLKERNEHLTCKNTVKDRLILELREGSKVLEDQLRLMDEKYLELRTKLDWARETGARKIKKAEKTASNLRIKFALSGSTVMLDNIPIPENVSYTSEGGGGGISFSQPIDEMSWASDLMSAQNPHPGPLRSALTPGLRHSHSGGFRNKVNFSGNMSVGSDMSLRSKPSLDNVLNKIRSQTGEKKEWNTDEIKKLTSRKK